MTRWDSVENELLKISEKSYKKLHPEAALFIAIIIQAAKDGDRQFLLSDGYRLTCKLAGLDPKHTLKLLP